MAEKLKIAIIVKGGAITDVLMSPAAEQQVHYIIVDLDENGDSPAVPAAFVDAIPDLQDLVDHNGLDVVEDEDDPSVKDEDEDGNGLPFEGHNGEPEMTQEEAREELDKVLREQGML